MMKMAQSDVFISGMGGLGTEIDERKKRIKIKYIHKTMIVINELRGVACLYQFKSLLPSLLPLINVLSLSYV